MAFIFKDKVEETLNKVLKFVKTNKILVKFTCFALVTVLSLVVSIVACGITFGFNVNYSGKNIAVVGKTSVFDKAKELVLADIKDEQAQKAIAEPDFGFTITVADNLVGETEMADAIIQNTDDISVAGALQVNGEVVAYGDSEVLKSCVSSALTQYYVKDAENTSSFVDNVEVTEAYCLNTDIKEDDAIVKLVEDLDVKTVSTVTSDIKLSYSTKTVKTSSKYIGYSKVTTKGEKGLKREKAVVETVNGKETAKTVLKSEVIKEPVTQVVEKGTKVRVVSATEKAQATSAGFIRPMNKSDVKLITAYWGDGRGHRGIDLAGDTGSPIFAAKAGTVISSGWDGNYGYAVVIDHGNGYKTRYAHCSALCVKRGQTVSQGQQIARLGNTGRSTGPHLHFEILKNNSQINPAPYIGY